MSFVRTHVRSGFDLRRAERDGAGEVLARVRRDDRGRWYAVAQHGDLVLSTQKCTSTSAQEAELVAVRWLRARGVLQ